MSEKAQRENEQLINEQRNKNMERTNERKATKRRRTRKFDGFGLTNRMHIDAGKEANKAKTEDTEIEVDEDEIVVKQKDEGKLFNRFRKKDNKPSNDIFQRFLEEQDSKINEYIHEKELLKTKNKNRVQN